VYESEGLKQQRRRRQIITAGVLALVLAAAVAAMVFAAGGSDSKASGCVIADVSESTSEARSRYAAAFGEFASGIGNEGSGELCLVVAAAKPLTEGTPISAYVGPDPEHVDKPQAKGDVEQRVQTATSQLSQLLAEPSVDQKGSALVEAATVTADVLEPGDRLLILSDGFQWSPTAGHLQEMDLDPVAIEDLIRKLDGIGLVPDLEGVEIEFPFMLLHPGGLPNGEETALGIKSFWKAWVEETGAEMVLPGQA